MEDTDCINWEWRPPGFPQIFHVRAPACFDAGTRMAFLTSIRLHSQSDVHWIMFYMNDQLPAYSEWSTLHKTPIASTKPKYNQMFVKNKPYTTLFIRFFITSNLLLIGDLLAYVGSEWLAVWRRTIVSGEHLVKQICTMVWWGKLKAHQLRGFSSDSL